MMSYFFNNTHLDIEPLLHSIYCTTNIKTKFNYVNLILINSVLLATTLHISKHWTFWKIYSMLSSFCKIHLKVLLLFYIQLIKIYSLSFLSQERSHILIIYKIYKNFKVYWKKHTKNKISKNISGSTSGELSDVSGTLWNTSSTWLALHWTSTHVLPCTSC